MENTNYVAKAKELMLKTARTTALVIVPLAAAVSAQAGAILPTTNLTCTATSGGGSGSCSMGVSSFADQGGIQGVSFFTNSGSIGFDLSSGGTVSLQVGAGGPLSGNLTQNDPVAFLFFFSLISGGSIASWSIDMSFGNALGSSIYGSFTASGSGGSGGSIMESGSGTLVVPSGGVASGSTFWETATINAVVSGGIFLQLSIPQTGTIDFDSAPASGVPEPASVGLIGSGLAFLGYLFRRRRKS